MVDKESEVVNTSGRFDQFHALPEEKQRRILNAAFAEFGEKGFQHASTNEIVKHAGIGKGMLFYYFGSKHELFEFLVDYTLEFAQTLRDTSADNGDFIDRCGRLSQRKRRAMEESPEVFRFLESLYHPENAPESERYLPKLQALQKEHIAQLFEGLDYSLLREDLRPEDALRHIQWVLEGYERDLTRRLQTAPLTPEAAAIEWKRFEQLLTDLHKAYYKQQSNV